MPIVYRQRSRKILVILLSIVLVLLTAVVLKHYNVLGLFRTTVFNVSHQDRVRWALKIFKAWSIFSTALSSLIVGFYFLITGAYNWRRSYNASRRSQSLLQEQPSRNAAEWKKLQERSIPSAWPFPETNSDALERHQLRKFLMNIKVFQHIDEEGIDQLLQYAQLKSVPLGHSVKVKRTDLVFVTQGSFRTTFLPSELTVTSPRSTTLSSYAAVMRSLAVHFNVQFTAKPATELQIPDLPVQIVASQEVSQILILGRECFIQLAEWSELSVAHLTQVILSRFKRATLPVLLNYLNLHAEMNEFLEYFIKRKCNFNEQVLKWNELSASFQSISEEVDILSPDARDRILKQMIQYLIQAFELRPGRFASMEASPALLASHISLHSISNKNEVLQAEGRECIGAILLFEGELSIQFPQSDFESESESLHTKLKKIVVKQGDFVGLFSVLMGKCSAIEIISESPTCKFACLSPHLVEMISERDPRILFSNFPPNAITNDFIEFLDLCVDWQQRPCGTSILDGKDRRIFRVLHGRIRALNDRGEALKEYGIGSLIGEQDIFTKQNQEQDNPLAADSNPARKQRQKSVTPFKEHQISATAELIAIRQSELASFPIELIEGLISSYGLVAKSLLPRLLERTTRRKEICIDPIKTICLLPIGIEAATNPLLATASNPASVEKTCDLPRLSAITLNAQRIGQMQIVEQVAEGLEHAFAKHQVTWTSIDSGRAADLMGRKLFTTLGTLKMNEFLAAQEDVTRILIYIADGVFSSWTRECISQADLILLIAAKDSDVVELGDLERQMLHLNPLLNVELCLASKYSGARENTRQWLMDRPWIRAHHHVQLERSNDPLIVPHNGNEGLYGRNLSSTTNLLQIAPLDLLNNFIRKSSAYLLDEHPHPSHSPHHQYHSHHYSYRSRYLGGFLRKRLSVVTLNSALDYSHQDFGRLARRILGRSIGLVLGGGGARGLAHIGIIRALQEAGIEIDLIGGTSIGALVGGLVARDQDIQRTVPPAGLFSKAVSSRWRQLLDLTYPSTSWFTGHAMNRVLWKYFGFNGLEDYPIPCFAVTTDLTRSRLQVHRTGPAWQYIRASMSLSGFLPPVCDARDGTLLVDGGYLANVPIEMMQSGSMTELSGLRVIPKCLENRDALSASVIIAVDIGRASDRVPVFYGDSLSGWTVLARKAHRAFLKRFYSTDDAQKLNQEVSVPLTLDEIQFRLVYASSAGLLSRTLQRTHAELISELENSPNSFVTSEVKSSHDPHLPTVFYLRPPGILKWGTLEFQKWEKIMQEGYEYGKRLIAHWTEVGYIDSLLALQGKKTLKSPKILTEKQRNIDLDSRQPFEGSPMMDECRLPRHIRRSSI